MPNTGKLISSIINNNISLDLNPDTIYNFTLYSKNGSKGDMCVYETTDSYKGTTSTKLIAYANGGAGGAGVYLSLIDINDKQKYVAIGGGGGGRDSDDTGLYRGGLGTNGATINGLFLGGTGIDGTDSDYRGGKNGKLLGPSPIQYGRFGSNFLGSDTFSNVSSDSAYCKISYTY